MGHPVHPQRGWEDLRSMELRLRRPRPMYQDSDPAEQEALPLSEQPMKSVNRKYQWLWLTGLVDPTTDNTYWWIVPFLNSQVFSQVLAGQASEPRPAKRLCLSLRQVSVLLPAN